MTRSRLTTLLTGAVVVPLAALAVAGCGSSGDNATAATAPTTPSGTTATVGAATLGGVGKVLVDSQGRTLYIFRQDTSTTSTCLDACAAGWPPARVSGKPTVGAGLTKSMVGTTKRTDGQPQLTYNGHPLYRFIGDQKPGDVNGQGTNAFGGLWYVIAPSGDEVTASASSSGSITY
jgi:predicted lipoprotein with Yx(FWY)xxD motif